MRTPIDEKVQCLISSSGFYKTLKVKIIDSKFLFVFEIISKLGQAF